MFAHVYIAKINNILQLLQFRQPKEHITRILSVIKFFISKQLLKILFVTFKLVYIICTTSFAMKKLSAP